MPSPRHRGRPRFAAPKRSALRAQEKPTETTLQLGAIGQVSRTVSDIAAAENWYARVLGLKHLYSFGMSAPHLIHRHADGTEEWLAVFKDPDGRRLAIMSQAGP